MTVHPPEHSDTWTVRVTQLPRLALDRTDYGGRDEAWLAYLTACDQAPRRACGASGDVLIGVELHHGYEVDVIEQRWWVVRGGVLTSGTSIPAGE